MVSVTDDVADRLAALEGQIRAEYDGVVTVNSAPGSWAPGILFTEVEPAQPDRCRVWWWLDEDEIQCGIGHHASFERHRDLETVAFVEWLVEAAADGTVVEVTGMNDVFLLVRTSDGRKLRYLAISRGELFRLPWNRKVRYLPWRAR
jgi:hypothetical protein